jgi:hypothetical protein
VVGSLRQTLSSRSKVREDGHRQYTGKQRKYLVLMVLIGVYIQNLCLETYVDRRSGEEAGPCTS